MSLRRRNPGPIALALGPPAAGLRAGIPQWGTVGHSLVGEVEDRLALAEGSKRTEGFQVGVGLIFWPLTSHSCFLMRPGPLDI